MNAKLHTIQYLRAVAAILVLVSHALLYPVSGQVLSYGRLGWLGVIMFFAVSGFIMVVVTGHESFDPLKFLRRRVLRIVPLYWALTLLAAALAIVVPSLFKTTVFDFAQLVLSLAFVPFYNPASHGLHPLYKLGWTLNYEMFFYLCFALLAVLSARRRALVLTLAYVALAIIGGGFQPGAAIPAFYTSYMPLAFVAGMWLGIAHIEGHLQRVVPSMVVPLAILALGGLVVGFSHDQGVVEEATAFGGLLLFVVSVLALAAGLEPRLPRLPLLERLGDASYSIYLVHIFAVGAVAGVALHMVGTSDPLIVGAILLLAIVGGLGAGWLLYRLVEEPMMRALRQRA